MYFFNIVVVVVNSFIKNITRLNYVQDKNYNKSD